MASKGLGPLHRRTGSALACGCDRSGRVVLRLARAAAVSTGLRVRGARGVTSHLQRGRERVPRQRDATRDARRERLAGRVGRQDPGRRIIAFSCSRRHHSGRRREMIVDHGTVFLEEPGNRWSAARSPHRLSRWPEAREGKREQDDHQSAVIGQAQSCSLFGDCARSVPFKQANTYFLLTLLSLLTLLTLLTIPCLLYLPYLLYLLYLLYLPYLLDLLYLLYFTYFAYFTYFTQLTYLIYFTYFTCYTYFT